MARRPLKPDTLLDIRLDAIMSRNECADDPAPVLNELRRVAGDRPDILSRSAGRWAGYHEIDPRSQVLVAALLEIGDPNMVQLGRERRAAPPHTTPHSYANGSTPRTGQITPRRPLE